MIAVAGLMVALPLLGAAQSSDPPILEPRASLSFDDVCWSTVSETLTRLLHGAPVIGELPNCRMTIELHDLSVHEVLRHFNQVYGLAFVGSEQQFTIFLPSDTSRMCSTSPIEKPFVCSFAPSPARAE